MQLGENNLCPDIRKSVETDILKVAQLSAARGIPAPAVRIRAVALDQEPLPSGLPKHDVPTPAAQAPEWLAKRCDWQTQQDSFQIIESGSDIWVIGGGNTGAMYGVNEWLGCRTGVIWANENEDGILFGPTRRIPLAVQKPRFAYRGRYGGSLDWFGRNKLNFAMAGGGRWASLGDGDPQKRLAADKERGIQRTLSEHAMGYYLPPDVLDAHPDWMGLRKGKRCKRDNVVLPDCPHLNSELAIQPCYSNQDAAEYITDRMAEARHRLPGIHFFGVWPHDGVNNWCQCEACQSKSPYEHMYDLALRLRKKLRSNTALELIVYSNMLNLPRHKLPVNDATYAFFCVYLRYFRHRIFDEGGPRELVLGTRYPEPDRINPVDEREYGELFRRWLPVWQAAGTTPGIFEYDGSFTDETKRTDHQRYLRACPPQFREDEAIWYAKHGVRMTILCGGGCEWPDAFPNLAWAQAQWGNEPIAAFKERYYTALAGSRGHQLAAALDGVADALRESDDLPDQALRDLDDVLATLPDAPYVSQYRDWAEYVKLGRQARGLLLAGKFAEAAEAEKRVRAFVKQRGAAMSAVSKHLNLHSEVYEKRAVEALAGRKSTEYTL